MVSHPVVESRLWLGCRGGADVGIAEACYEALEGSSDSSSGSVGV